MTQGIELGKIYNEDCLEFLSRVPDKSAALAWFDPPYNVGKDYGTTSDDSLPDTEYLEWIGQVIDEAKRVALAVCVFVPTKYGLCYWNRLGPNFKQIILSWSPEGTFRGNFVNQFSFLLTDAKPVNYTKNVWHNRQMSGLGWFFRENTYGHPGYTSEDITAKVVNSFTTTGQLVIDPFMGTGTTAVICERMNRLYTGSEINPDYCKIAEKRIENERSQLKLAI